MSESVAERKLRDEVLNYLPNRKDANLSEPICIQLDAANILATEQNALHEAITRNDLSIIMRRYLMRQTPALTRIPERLGFKSRKEYEKAVLQLLKRDEEMLSYVKEPLGNI